MSILPCGEQGSPSLDLLSLLALKSYLVFVYGIMFYSIGLLLFPFSAKGGREPITGNNEEQ